MKKINLAGLKNFSKKKYKLSSVNRYAYLFLLPFFLTFLIFQLYPMIYSVALSFTDSHVDGLITYEGTFIKFDNYLSLWKNEFFWQSIRNTFIIFLMNFIPQIVSALFFAVVFTSVRYKIKGKALFRFIYFLPNIITAASVAVLFDNLFTAQTGPLWQIMLDLGIINADTNFYVEVWPTRIIIAFIQFWMWFGNSMIVYIAGINGINREIFEAADLDGASPFQQFFYITFPILKPIMLYSLITSVIGGLSMFDIPMLFSGLGPGVGESGLPSTQTITMYIYSLGFDDVYADYGMASAASVYLFFISLFFSLILNLWLNREDKPLKKVKKVNAHE